MSRILALHVALWKVAATEATSEEERREDQDNADRGVPYVDDDGRHVGTFSASWSTPERESYLRGWQDTILGTTKGPSGWGDPWAYSAGCDDARLFKKAGV
jgi:hypothetical protein